MLTELEKKRQEKNTMKILTRNLKIEKRKEKKKKKKKQPELKNTVTDMRNTKSK